MSEMTKSPLVMISEIASEVFRLRVNSLSQGMSDPLHHADPILEKAMSESSIFILSMPLFNDFVDAINLNPEFELIAPRDGVLDPMVFQPGGGVRLSSKSILYSIFSTAFQLIYFLGLPLEESVYLRMVLEGFEELRKALRGEPVRGYKIKGLGLITIPPDKQFVTPWGTIRPVTPIQERGFPRFGQPTTSALLIEPKLLPIVFDRENDPNVVLNGPNEEDLRSEYLLPLSFALASKDHLNPVVPVTTWGTVIVPFQGFFGYSSAINGPIFQNQQDASQLVIDLENWARIVDKSHTQEVDVAAKRLVSAVAHRIDKADALIDAVMVWENLLGTSNEVTFRVSASLAKLIESDPAKRVALKKSLSNVYSVRSRIVHGTLVDTSTVQNACTEAIGTAVLALRESYTKGKEWLSMKSTDRSEEILLSWQ